MPTTLTLPRRLLWALALLLAAASIAYGALWMFYARWEPAARLGIELEETPDRRAIHVLDVVEGTPVARAGLRPGDLIVAVNGQPLDTLAPFYDAVTRGQPGDGVEFEVRRPNELAPLRLRAELIANPHRETPQSWGEWGASEIVNSYPVLFLAVGLPVLFLRLEDRHAWLLALLFASFIAGAPLLLLEPGIHPALRGFALFYKILGNGMVPALFYTFFAVFPEPSPMEQRLPWLKWTLLALSAGVGLPLAIWAGGAGSPQPLLRFAGQIGGRLVEVTLVGYFFAGIGLGLVSLVWNGLRGASAETRRKLRVVMWGTVVGLVPFLLLFAVSLQMDRDVYEFPFWVWVPTVLCTFLMPLSMAYAVVKHRVLAVPVLLKRSARYVLVRRSVDLLLLLLAVVFYEAAARLVDFARETFVRVQPETTLISGVGIGMLFGAIFLLAHRTLQRRVGERIDRAFFRRAYDARQILEDLGEKTRAATSREELATLLRHHIREAFYPRTRYVYLEDAQGRLAATSSAVPSELEVLPRDWPLLEELARHGRPWEVPPQNRMLVAAPFLPVALALQHLAALEAECLVPLLGRDQRLAGLLVIGPRMSEEPYSSEDKRLLASVAVQAATALESIRLAEQMAERLEAEHQQKREIEIAHEVQARLLPRKQPPLRTLDYVGRCLQAHGVGGDFYDFLELDSNQTGLVLTDIAGKGIHAALLMANLQANLRSQYAVALDDLPRLLRSVNRLFCESTEAHHYATVFFSVYDDSTRRLRYENCGHNPPLLVGPDGRVERLKGTATVLGMFEAWDCSVVETELRPGDLLVIYSDGVTEAFSDAGEIYGEARLLDAIRAHRERPVAGLLDAIVDDVVKFSGRVQEDDLTLIVARCR